MDPPQKHEKIKLVEINSYLTCYLCKGYLIDATTISECLHSFCRSCIIKFLQENCYCPVCEVIINKAKPCLKLDKTLQDIVYKLVPGLFVKEMYRRKEFYQERPDLAPKVSPEERGEDTERTIFNPQDAISLSIEYISDDSAPGAIPSLPMQKNGTPTAAEEPQDNPMKRYLQCPGMCRIEVLKKFVRNKYNVDTNRFHIDILYKRVPLPDHYTLIDIGYIYSWKRNEPMKFFFRITDINKVTERFDYFDGRMSPEVIPTPTKIKERASKSEKKKEAASHIKEKKHEVKPVKQENCEVMSVKSVKCDVPVSKTFKNEVLDQKPSKTEVPSPKPLKSEVLSSRPVKTEMTNLKAVKNVMVSPRPARTEVTNLKVVKNEVATSKPVKTEVTNSTSVKNEVIDSKSVNNGLSSPKPVKNGVSSPKPVKNGVSSPKLVKNGVSSPKPVKKDVAGVKVNEKSQIASVKPEKDVKSEEIILKPEITEEIKNQIQSGKGDIKNSVYTNITLNRDNNVEIITKIQKVSNKEGHPIGLNIIKKTKVQNKNRPSDPNLVPSNCTETKKPETKTEEENKEKEELEKSNFLKSIELTAKSSLINHVKKEKEVKPPVLLPPTIPSSSAQKRKNSSPMKNDKTQEKKPKIEKKPMKIIIQPKTIPNPTVRQMVTNVNQNVNNMSKIVEQTNKQTDLQSLINNCKINIPSSLSITLNEGGEGGARTPPSIPPVKNYIEILKLPDNRTEEKDKDKEAKDEKNTAAIKDKNRNLQSFQKIFEESINKKSPETPKTEQKPTPLDLTSNNDSSPTTTPKRKILEIASQLQKKTKIEQEKKNEVSLGKIAIPRLATQRTLKPPSHKYDFGQNRPQTSASLHSSSLGLNYTVSVGQAKVNGDVKHDPKLSPSTSKNSTKTTRHNGTMSGPKNLTMSPKNNGVSAPKNLSPNQLLEKYNIQNLAQLTASFNFNPASYGALQHAMLLKQMEHHSWLNQGPLLQYEKYLQSLATQNKLMGNIKEN